MSLPPMQFDTRLIHAGEPDSRIQGAVVLPVFQSSTYEFSGETDYHHIRYIRLNNTPNHLALHGKLAALEEGEAALVTASGMAAISTTLLSVLSAGDHFLIQDSLYGGTYTFVTHDLPTLGISFDFIDGQDPDSWREKLRSSTRAVYVESMTNPLLEVADLLRVAAFAREHGLVSMIDNTFPSPVNFRPLTRGFDLSLHSGTKYLNGHTDITAGAVIGREPLMSQISRRLSHLGGTLDPHACFLLNRGMKTLALRVRQQNWNAGELARFLEQHPMIERVYYPGLESHPQYRRAAELFSGSGGMLSFEVRGSVEKAKQVVRRTRLAVEAPSLGGVETLVTRPATTSHSGLTPEERLRYGITDSLVRVSVGIEAVEDLIQDFDQALRG